MDLSSFQYYQIIEYTGCDRDVYQQDVVIHRSLGENYEEIVNGLNIWHIFVGDKCREDYGDIRFTKAGGTSELNYYLINCDANGAKFTVRLEGVNEAGDVTVWYGNSDVVTSSNGATTYFFFNDFENQVVEGWQPEDAGTTLSIVQSGINGSYCLQINKSHSGYWSTDYCSVYKDVTLTIGVYLLTLFVKAHRHWEGDSYSTYYRIEYGGDVLQDYSLAPSSGIELALPMTSDGQVTRLYARGKALGYVNSALIHLDNIAVRAYSATPPHLVSSSGECRVRSASRCQSVLFGSSSMMIV